MFSVNRFDGSQSQSQSDLQSSNKVNDKLAKLNQKIQSKKAINPSTTTSASTPSTTPSISTSTPSTSLIHPSRLSIPALRASDNKNKAKSSSNPAGSGSGKTKAKQRYEQAKKARRKNREISKKGKKPGEGKGKNKERHEGRDLESRLNRKRERSRSVTATATQEEKVKVGETQTQTQNKRNNIFDLKELKRSEKEGKSLDNGWSGRKIGKNQGGVQEKKINGEEKEGTSKEKEKETESSDSDSDSSDSDSNSSSSSSEEEEAKTEGEKDADLQIQEDSTISNQPEPEMEIDPSTIGESIGLSRFPLPKRNMRSDPSLLALQGLSKGLANPLLVDPSLREKIQIDQDEVNGKDKKRKRNEKEVESEATGKKKGKLGEEENSMDDEEDEHEEMEDLKEDSSINHSSEGKGKGLELVCEPIRKQLAKIGISEWFAVQATVIPLLLSTPLSRSLYPHSSISDLCISAPTGSGKTLSYVIPILEVLRRRKVKKLRALVLLPTRDLVSQVKETFDLINKNLISEEEELKIGICTGNSSFIQEQNSLVEKKLNFNSNDLDFDDQDSLSLNSSSPTTKENSNRFIYSSKVDILLSTPGRLIDHLKSTKGFDLKHLRFLVIDEADRLMGQSFQEWIGRLEEEIDPKRFGKRDQDQDEEVDAPAWLKRDQDDLDQEVPSSVQKLLFSATLTRDPSQIQTLNLRNPKYVSVQDSTSSSTTNQDGEEIIGFNQVQTLPSTLIEHMLILPSSLKPLYLIELLHRKPEMAEETTSLGPIKNALCFTKSLESAKRLVSLLRNFEEIYASLMEEENDNFSPLEIREYSSDLNKVEKREILKEFREGKVDVLICSDLISRGMDLPHVEHVISYDSPVDITKYVHRVGRTARANRIGHAWSLVEEQEARYFKKMQSKAGRRSKVKKEKSPSEEKLEVFRKAYELALNKTAEMFTH